MDDIINRWHLLYKGLALSQHYLKGESLGKAELSILSEQAEHWRERLMGISWFMRFIDEATLAACMSININTGRSESNTLKGRKNTRGIRSHPYIKRIQHTLTPGSQVTRNHNQKACALLLVTSEKIYPMAYPLNYQNISIG